MRFIERPPVRLFVASLVGLFFELLLIRWIPANVHIFGYFSNLVLLGCFVGLGIGVAREGSDEVVVGQAWRRILFIAALVTAINLSMIDVRMTRVDLDTTASTWLSTPLVLPLYGLLPLLFGLVIWAFIPLGSIVGGLLPRLPRIAAYSVNILGSLAGVLAFAVMSYFELPPVVWFAVGLVLLVWLMPPSSTRTGYGAASLLVVALLFGAAQAEQWQRNGLVYWSPHYKILEIPQALGAYGLELQVNNSFLLTGVDQRPAADLPEQVKRLQQYYNFPYAFMPRPQAVLVLGAGAGNDVAAALQHDVPHVDAVEIDPTVARIGRLHHPNRPYEDPRVHLHLGDARTFLNNCTRKYDLIIYATLDSHGLFSQMSSVRMENYVFTEESIKAARRLLSDRGVLVQSSGPFMLWVHLRMFATIRAAFDGRPPWMYIFDEGNSALVDTNDAALQPPATPQFWKAASKQKIETALAENPWANVNASDDWPYLYVRTASIPMEYWIILAIVVVVSALFVWRAPETSLRRPDFHFFFLGAGFLLLETKSISEFALLFGATWMISSIVISAFLLVILLANLLAARISTRIAVAAVYPLLFAALLMNYFVPLRTLLSGDLMTKALLSSLFLTLPVFFAALIFATSFRACLDAREAFSWNLLGAVLGGLSEYASMVVGFKALYLLALIMYAISYVSLLRARTVPPVTA